jgi:hypothetical protein
MYGRVEHLGIGASVAALNNVNRLLMSDFLVVGAVLPQGIIDVTDGNDSGLKSDLLSTELIRISTPVPFFVVLECDHCG